MVMFKGICVYFNHSPSSTHICSNMNVLAVASGCGTNEREFLHLLYSNSQFSDYLGLKHEQSLFDSQHRQDIYLSLYSIASRIALGPSQPASGF